MWRIIAPLIFANTFILISIFSFLPISTSFASNSFELNKLTNIYNIIQDQQGFIWLGGQQGLTRFDGKQSINFSYDNPKHLLPFNWIQDFVQDNDSLLIATETHGLWRMNTKTGQAQLIVSNVGGIDDSSFNDIAIFRESYYFQTSNSLYKYQPKTDKTYLISDEIVVKEIVHTKEQLYISSQSGLYQLQDGKLKKLINEPITTVIAINNTLIAITARKIYAIKDAGEQFSVLIDESISQATKQYNQENFFSINNQGVINKYSAIDLKKLPHRFQNIKASRVLSMLHDSSGVLWLTSNQGIERLYESSIKDHPKVFDIKTNANEIVQLNDEIIIGSYGAGLQNFIRNTFDDKTNNNFSSNGLRITNLVSVEHELFIATFDGLWLLSRDSQQVSRVNFPDNDKLILKLKYKDNLLYIATNDNGLYAFDLAKQKILWNIKSEDGLSSSEVIDLLPLANGQVWLTTAKGLDIYDTNTGIITNIDISGGKKLVAITLAENKVFAASLGDGIFALNLQGQLLAHIGQGISFSGLLIEKNEIWASARPGLYRLNPKNYQLSMLENTGEYSFIGSSLVHNDALYSSHYGGILELNLTKQPIFHPKVLISKTTVSGESYLLNKTIKVASSNDLITLDLASLDYRPGLGKKYQYRINNSGWQAISGAQLTLTGLASGDYNIEIMATNSLGQWSDNKAYTEIHVAYPWYWTVELRIIYVIFISFLVLLASWLLFLRAKSINRIHHLLKDDMRNYGRVMKTIQRNLQLTSTSLANNELEQGKQLVEKSISILKESINSQEPDNLAGKTLAIAIPFLANYIHSKYEVNLHFNLDDKVDSLTYELKADVYKVIFEAIMSATFKSEAENFSLTLKEVKQKLWLTVNSDNDSFKQLTSKVNFDLGSYTIRQIINKNHASLNSFSNDDGSSQLVISFPLMALN
ncbi:MAG: hypothetical protein MJK15_13950 [Colwellia sp.]|nr:hypothetical protein [Colwellia sp.]